MPIQAREAIDRRQGILSGLGPVAEDGTGGTTDSGDTGKVDKGIESDEDDE